MDPVYNLAYYHFLTCFIIPNSTGVFSLNNNSLMQLNQNTFGTFTFLTKFFKHIKESKSYYYDAKKLIKPLRLFQPDAVFRVQDQRVISMSQVRRKSFYFRTNDC